MNLIQKSKKRCDIQSRKNDRTCALNKKNRIFCTFEINFLSFSSNTSNTSDHTVMKSIQWCDFLMMKFRCCWFYFLKTFFYKKTSKIKSSIRKKFCSRCDFKKQIFGIQNSKTMSSSFDHLMQYSIGFVCLLISIVCYFFYFNSITPTNDKTFLVTYLQSIMFVISSTMFCLFENSRFKLIRNKKNRLVYCPLNQFEDLRDLFETDKSFNKRTDHHSDKTFLTEPVFEPMSDDDDDEHFESKYQDNNYDEYLVKINEKYNEMTKEDAKRSNDDDRKVTFNRKKEIRYLRYLSDVYARSAIFSRLSYESFMKFNYQLLNQYTDLSFSNSLVIVPIYSFIHFFSIYFANLSLNYFFEPIGYFDLSSGFSLIFIIAFQYLFFSPPSFNENITLTKTVICLISLLSLYLIKISSNFPFINITTTSDSNFINQTIINDPNIVDLFSIKLRSIIYTLLSSFLSTFFLVSIRNQYEQDNFDLKIFASFLSIFIVIVFGALLLFVLNQHITEPILPYRNDLISILYRGLMGPTIGNFFLIM